MSFSKRKQLYGTALFTGVISISSYILLYTHQDWVTRNFTRGGLYAALPIGTAFYFSFVHGTFTSCLLDLLGLRAATKVTLDAKKGDDSSQGEVQP